MQARPTNGQEGRRHLPDLVGGARPQIAAVRWIWLISSVVVVGGFALLATLAAVSRRPRPSAGLIDGRLRPCPRSSNCACSEESGPSGTASISFDGSGEEALARLARAIVDTGGMIETAETDPGNYLHALYVTSFFGFIDDVEARWDRARGILHLRSASRVGLNDRGLNRRRLSSLRAAFASARATPPLATSDGAGDRRGSSARSRP